MTVRTAWRVVGGVKGGARRLGVWGAVAAVPEGCWGRELAGSGEGGEGMKSSGWESR